MKINGVMVNWKRAARECRGQQWHCNKRIVGWKPGYEPMTADASDGIPIWKQRKVKWCGWAGMALMRRCMAECCALLWPKLATCWSERAKEAVALERGRLGLTEAAFGKGDTWLGERDRCRRRDEREKGDK